MRVLLTTTPFYGSFHPVVPMARALVAAGHQVQVACPPSFRGAVESARLPFVAAGSEIIPPDLHAELDAARPDAPRRSRLMLTRVMLGVHARAMVPDLLSLIDTWHPDLLLRGHLEYGGYVAAELRHLPHASTGAVNFPPPALHAAMLEALAALREAFNLPPDPDGTSPFRYAALAPVPRSWVPPDATVPPTMHFLRPEPFNASGDERLPATVAALPPDRPTVHASLGTLHNDVPGVYEAILEGLRVEPVNLVLTVGRERDPREFVPQPTSVVIERYIAHELLLPHCHVMLTHCGLNSIMACLVLGLPMVGVPITADQPRNAQRLAELGVAVVVPAEERTPERFRAATREVLSKPSYRENAGLLRDEIAAMPGSELGVTLLERLARDRQPLLAGKPA